MATPEISSLIFLENPRYISQKLSSAAVVTCPLDFGTIYIREQSRLRRTCASAQSSLSFCCSHTKSMNIDDDSDKN